MERLTKEVFAFNGTSFMQIKDCGNDTCAETCRNRTGEKACKGCPIQIAIDRLAEYEDLEEQGKLLKLPCKVGQKVYLLRKDIKSVIDGGIISIRIGEFAREMKIFIIDDDRYTDVSFDKIGDIVFLTREAAEAALKELKEAEKNE